MKKRILRTVMILYIVIFSLCGCESKTKEITQPHSEAGVSCDVYYINNLTQTLESETVSLKSEKQNDIILEAYGNLVDIEKTDERKSVVPEGLEINSIRLNSGILSVDFNAVYNSMTAGEELMFKTAVVYTFTSFDFVDYVYITVQGNTLKMTNGSAVGKIGRDDIVMNGDISAEPTNYEILTLYFENNDGSKLDTEIREVVVNPNLPLERYVVEQLIEGPQDTNLKSTIPADTKIRDISTADGICYVDLSSDFVTKQSDSMKDATAAVYSIANSLGEIEGISKIQFLIEGEKVDDYKKIMDLSKLVVPNYDIAFE